MSSSDSDELTPKARAVLEACRTFKFRRLERLENADGTESAERPPGVDWGYVYRRSEMTRVCEAIEAWREELATLDTEKVAVPEMVVHLEREK